MATANFRPMEYGHGIEFPLICGCLGCDECCAFECYSDTEDDLFYFNRELDYLKVKVLPGYYEGWQFWVDVKYFPENKEEKTEFRQEIESVRAFLYSIKETYGLTELALVATFGNGETIYKEVR